MSTHTPGPWTATTDGKLPILITADNDNRWKDAITRIGTVGGPLFGPDDFEEDEANAALIAAAPDLIAALRAAIPVLAADRSRQGVYAYQQACAAIAKAEGVS